MFTGFFILLFRCQWIVSIDWYSQPWREADKQCSSSSFEAKRSFM